MNIQYRPEAPPQAPRQAPPSQSRSMSQEPKNELIRSGNRQQPITSSGHPTPKINFKVPQQQSVPFQAAIPISHQAPINKNYQPVQFGKSSERSQHIGNYQSHEQKMPYNAN